LLTPPEPVRAADAGADSLGRNLGCFGRDCTQRYEVYLLCCNQPVYAPGVEGFGTMRNIICDDFLRDKATPETRQGICRQIKSKALTCPVAEQSCYSPKKASDCPDNMTFPAQGYAQDVVHPSQWVYKAPSTASERVPNGGAWGSLIGLYEARQVNGEAWYRIKYSCRQRPALQAVTGAPDYDATCEGWVPGKSVSCTRPSAVPPGTAERVPIPSDIFGGRT
jgi:hypothetical protein